MGNLPSKGFVILRDFHSTNIVYCQIYVLHPHPGTYCDVHLIGIYASSRCLYQSQRLCPFQHLHLSQHLSYLEFMSLLYILLGIYNLHPYQDLYPSGDLCPSGDLYHVRI